MITDIDRDILKRIDFECTRLQDFAYYARNRGVFELMADTRDATYMHMSWLNDLISELSASSRSTLSVSALKILSSCVESIKQESSSLLNDDIFHFCTVISWDIQAQVRDLLEKG